MRFEVPAITACILLFCTSAAVSEEAFVEKAGRNFPRAVTVNHNDQDFQLSATGTALRKKFVVKVYAMAHYMDTAEFADKDAALAAARSGKHPSQITMEFMRDVGADKIRDAYTEGFQKNSSEDDFGELAGLVTLFVSFFDDVKKNDQIVLQRFPDGTVYTTVAGEKKDDIHDERFATVLWNIWFGDHSPVDRNDLVKLAVSKGDE